MSTEIVYKRKNLMGNVRPPTISLPISYILTMIPYINFDHKYQRTMCWSENMMCGLIGSIMDNAFVPSVVLYKYQDKIDPEYPTYKHEAVDGKHRLTVINAFASSKYLEIPNKKKSLPNKPNIKKKILVRWVYTDPERNKINIFHHETDETKEWSRINGKPAYYLSDKDRQDFDDFNIDIRMIELALPYEQRREIFVRLQNGEKNRGFDKNKNNVHIPIIEHFDTQQYENFMDECFFKHCSIKANKYGIEWFIRLYFFFITSKNNDDSYSNIVLSTLSTQQTSPILPNILLVGDSEIRKMIESNDDRRLEVDHEQILEFDAIIQRYFEFLDSNDVPLNPTQMFALFTHFCYNTNFEENLSTNMKNLSKSGMDSKYKKMWEGKKNCNYADRRNYFIACLQEFYKKSREPAIIVTDKKQLDRKIPAKLRKDVWKKYYGNNEKGLCQCGRYEITNQKGGHECGHIIASNNGGLTNINNLRPICKTCNTEMHTMNMDEFYTDKFGIPVSV